MKRRSTDIAFSPSVKAEQVRRGSRAIYQRLEDAGGLRTEITADLAALLASTRSFYLGTASAAGQPYIQHRGGPAGFLRVLDSNTLGFADYGGNQQYITLGNLAENPRAFMFIMDYAHRVRIKLWGRARMIEGDDALMQRLCTPSSGTPERCILFEIEAWDRNCRQHIPMLLPAEEVQATIQSLQSRIEELIAENAMLRHGRAP